jgi:hypothetical protein|nr:plasmid mobilization relaxosome protein MobC [uncultured Flavobacterium sp.]
MKNIGGAPKKEEQLKLKNRMILSFNESEFNLLTEKGLADGKILKTILMNSLAGKKIELSTNKDPKYIYILNKTAVNINQIARKINSTNQLSDSDMKKYFSLIDELQTLLTL